MFVAQANFFKDEEVYVVYAWLIQAEEDEREALRWFVDELTDKKSDRDFKLISCPCSRKCDKLCCEDFRNWCKARHRPKSFFEDFDAEATVEASEAETWGELHDLQQLMDDRERFQRFGEVASNSMMELQELGGRESPKQKRSSGRSSVHDGDFARRNRELREAGRGTLQDEGREVEALGSKRLKRSSEKKRTLSFGKRSPSPDAALETWTGASFGNQETWDGGFAPQPEPEPEPEPVRREPKKSKLAALLRREPKPLEVEMTAVETFDSPFGGAVFNHTSVHGDSGMRIGDAFAGFDADEKQQRKAQEKADKARAKEEKKRHKLDQKRDKQAQRESVKEEKAARKAEKQEEKAVKKQVKQKTKSDEWGVAHSPTAPLRKKPSKARAKVAETRASGGLGFSGSSGGGGGGGGSGDAAGSGSDWSFGGLDSPGASAPAEPKKEKKKKKKKKKKGDGDDDWMRTTSIMQEQDRSARRSGR